MNINSCHSHNKMISQSFYNLQDIREDKQKVGKKGHIFPTTHLIFKFPQEFQDRPLQSQPNIQPQQYEAWMEL